MSNPASGYITSIFGRRLGLQSFTTSQYGSTVGPQATAARVKGEQLVGIEGIRANVTTAETSGTSLASWGVSYLSTASVAATTQTAYTLDRPVQGVRKTLVFGSTNTATNEVSVWASSDASITFLTTWGSTMCVMRSTAGFVGTIELMGLTSAVWACQGIPAGSLTLTTKTT